MTSLDRLRTLLDYSITAYKKRRPSIWWIYNNYRKEMMESLVGGDFSDLVNGLVGVEIGIDECVNALSIISLLPIKKIYLIDPYEDYEGYDVSDVKLTSEYNTINKKINYVNSLLNMNLTGVEFIKQKSEDCVDDIPDNLDFVYIDGNHSYDYVMEDIIIWQRKVRKGGLVMGHDYNTFRGGNYKNYKREIAVAVNDYTEIHKIPFYLTDNSARHYKADRHASWFWIK